MRWASSTITFALAHVGSWISGNYGRQTSVLGKGASAVVRYGVVVVLRIEHVNMCREWHEIQLRIISHITPIYFNKFIALARRMHMQETEAVQELMNHATHAA